MICSPWDTASRLFRYKYLPFDEGSLRVISEGTLKYTHPADFNDPFESTLAYDLKSLNDFPKSGLFKKVGDFQGLSPAKRIQKQSQWRHMLQSNVESGGFTRDILKNIGILSLSRNPVSPLMWAHYADCHRGFLVEFDINIATTNQNELLPICPFPVIYAQDRPQIDLADRDNWQDCILTKSEEWSYEEEERVIDHDRGPGIHPYNRNKFLSSVIAGARLSDEHFEMLKHAVNDASIQADRDIKIYRAQLSNKHYKVFVPEHPFPELSSD